MANPIIHGTVAPGFEAVADAFVGNFTRRGEAGAAFAAYHCGTKVVDLWGGLRDQARGLPWEEHTMALVFSTTKGMSATAMAVAHSRGLFELDRPLAAYWPEFGQEGKERITVRQLLAHEAGLWALEQPLSPAQAADLEALSLLLARRKPLQLRNTTHAYHGMTLGWYQSELLRRVDPGHRSVGQFFQDEIARPLGVEFFIGLPQSVPDDRLAVLGFQSMGQALRSGGLTLRGLAAVLNRKSPFWQVVGGVTINGQSLADRAVLSVEIPSLMGVGEARGLAHVYGILATGGCELGLKPETLAEIARPAQGSYDPVICGETAYGMGFSKPAGAFRFGSDASAFGCPGMGGSLGFADPTAQVGFGYVCNRLGLGLTNDPRAIALSEALYRCLTN